MVSNEKKVAICVPLLVLVSFIVTMIYISGTRVVQLNQLGLVYSDSYKTLGKKAYPAGWHFIGLGYEFKYFDIKLKNYELQGIQCRSIDGTKVKLYISFQWAVIPEKVYDIYSKFGEARGLIYMKHIVSDEIDNVCTTLTAEQMFKKPMDVEPTFKKAL